MDQSSNEYMLNNKTTRTSGTPSGAGRPKPQQLVVSPLMLLQAEADDASLSRRSEGVGITESKDTNSFTASLLDTSATQLRNAETLSHVGASPVRGVTQPNRFEAWNPVTGWRKLEPSSNNEDLHHCSTLGYKFGMLASSSQSSSGTSTCFAFSRLMDSSGNEDSSDKLDHEPTEITVPSAVEAEPMSYLNASDNIPSTTSQAESISGAVAMAELVALKDEIVHIVLQQTQSVVRDAVRTSHRRGRQEALDEVRRSLLERATAKHVGVTERRILRREADIVARKDGVVGSSVVALRALGEGDSEDELVILISTVARKIEVLCDKGCAAIGGCGGRDGGDAEEELNSADDGTGDDSLQLLSW